MRPVAAVRLLMSKMLEAVLSPGRILVALEGNVIVIK